MKVLYVPFEGGEEPAWREEWEGLEEALGKASQGAGIDLRLEENADWADLPGLLVRERPDVLHLACHGEPSGRLLVRRQGRDQSVAAEELIRLLVASGARPDFVFLTTCYSAPLAEPLAREGFSVAGWEGLADVRVTAAFYAVLYELLACGESFGSAFAQAQGGVIGAAVQLGARPRHAGDTQRRWAAPSAPPADIRAEVGGALDVQQVVVLVDAYETGATMEDLMALLPRSTQVPRQLRLSGFMAQEGVARLTQGVDPPDWQGLARATEALGRAVLTAEAQGGRRLHLLLGGNAPQATFIHLGWLLSAWTGERVALVQWHPKAGRLLVELDAASRPTGERYFQATPGLAGVADSEAVGILGVFVGTSDTDVAERSIAEIGAMLRGSGRPFVKAVGIAHTRRGAGGGLTPLTDQGAGSAASELVTYFHNVNRRWSKAAGLAVATDGPSLLAYLIGRAINPRLVGEEGLALLWYQKSAAGNSYREAYRLPLPPRLRVEVPSDAESRLARRSVFDLLARAIVTLGDEIDPADMSFPAGFGPVDPGLAPRLKASLVRLARAAEIGEDQFEISLPRGRLVFGAPLLHALRVLPNPVLERFGALFLLHEALHDVQGLTAGTYRGVGRAGVVLEDADFWADTWALLVCLRRELRLGGARTAAALPRLCQDWIGAHLAGLAAFDRMDQPTELRELAERRLRRYLLWSLQRARAETVRTLADVEELFRLRLFAELAPVEARLDGRHDKLVREVRPETSLFVGLGAVVARFPKDPDNFDPAELVALVRQYETERLQARLTHVVDREARLLTPWTRAPTPAPARSRARARPG